MLYRPTKLKPRIRKITEEKPTMVDFAKDFGQVIVSDVALELERLKKEYRERIFELKQITDKTEVEVRRELEILNDKFRKEAIVLLENSSYAIFAELREKIENTIRQLEDKIKDAEVAISHAREIQKGDPGVKGDDGLSPDIDDIVNEAVAKIKPKTEIEEEKIIKMLFKKVFEKPLEIEKIKGLEERLRNLGTKIMFGGGGQGSWKTKVLSGTINGSNTVFTYAGELPAENSHRVILNYQEQDPLTDYTVSASGGTVTVTYTTAPDTSLAGVRHIIRYQ